MNDNTAAQPLDLDKLEALAKAARDDIIRSHGWAGTVDGFDALRVDEQYLLATNPATILTLIAQARATQPAGAADTTASASGLLNSDELAAFNRFCECAEDFDSGGHDVDKEMMAKLARIGVVRSTGFGRHETTAFGDMIRGYRASLAPVAAPVQSVVRAEVIERFMDYSKIAHLIGSIFFAGDFKAETANERELESLLVKTGHRYASWDEISTFRADDLPIEFSSVAPVAAQQAAAAEPLCPACQGSGEGLMMEGEGPDAYEVPCNCPYCGGSGGLLDAYNGLVALLAAEREKYLNACGKLFHASLAPQQAAAVAAPSVLPAELSNAFITLESSGGEGRTIVLKFNQRDDAYAVHHFLMTGGGKEWNAPATAVAATTSEDARDAARWRFSMQFQGDGTSKEQPEAIINMWRKVYAEHRLRPTREEYEAATDEAMRATQQEKK